jgi:hypothetical protein
MLGLRKMHRDVPEAGVSALLTWAEESNERE